MKRLISWKDCDCYCRLAKLIKNLKLDDDYKWLISDAEIYPTKSQLDLYFYKKQPFICTNKQLLEWLEADDFLWVWGVLSLFDPKTKKSDILNGIEPGVSDDNPCKGLLDKDIAIIQHPKAILEIDCWDSTLLIMSSNEDEYIKIFKKVYPKSKTNCAHI